MSDINVYHGLVNFKGNTGQAVVSVDAHRWYFNRISACSKDPIPEISAQR
jgi:hypothetical protein